MKVEPFTRNSRRSSQTMSPYTIQGLLRSLFIALFAAVALTGCAVTTEGGEEDLGELSEFLCTGVRLAATPAGPQAVGTSVTLTASGATCGAGQTAQYRFVQIRDGAAPVEIRPYGTNPIATWSTTGLQSGAYNVVVYARAVGTTVAYDSAGYVNPKYLLGNVCNNTTAFTASPASPQPAGTMVSLTSSATCTGGTAEFRYAYKGPSDANYVFLTPGYGPATQTWNTTGRASGNYSLLVYTRAVGNTSTSESVRYLNYQLGSVCANAAVVATPASPQPVGTMVSLTGSATCGSPQFRFSYRLYGDTTWNAIGGFGAANQVWNTTGRASGPYEILVEARQTGSTGGAESTAIINYALGTTCSTVTLGTSPPSPQGSGVLVTLTGAATCTGGGTAEYQFSYKAPGSSTVTLIRAYGTTATATLDTTGFPVGTYTLIVQSRAVGSTRSQDGSTSVFYVLSTNSFSQVVQGLGNHVCARVNNGTVRCWGANDVGQLGTGSVSAMSSLPVTVAGVSGVAAVATGGFHGCALLTNGTVRCWGQGTDGQLGNGGLTNSSSAVAVTGITDGIAISAGTYHNCVLRTGGAISCWGDNSYSQTGSSAVADFPETKTPVALTTITGASSVYAAGFHTCALVSGGVKCWGDNSLGALGNGGTPTKSATPVDVTGLTSGVTSVGGGDSHSCAVRGGAVQCWGDNTYGQLGNGPPSATPATTPVAVTGLTGVADVAAGFTFSCGRLTNRTVRCWGRNGFGELGNGTGTDSTTPVAVTGISTATSLTTGSLTSCAILANGSTQCWGYGANGALGNGSTSNALSPVTVSFP